MQEAIMRALPLMTKIRIRLLCEHLIIPEKREELTGEEAAKISPEFARNARIVPTIFCL
jgi:hypothetical protein